MTPLVENYLWAESSDSSIVHPANFSSTQTSQRAPAPPLRIGGGRGEGSNGSRGSARSRLRVIRFAGPSVLHREHPGTYQPATADGLGVVSGDLNLADDERMSRSERP